MKKKNSLRSLLDKKTLLPEVRDDSAKLQIALWRVWPSRIRFCCNGSCTTGPDIRMLIFTFVLFNVPMIAFIFSVGLKIIEFLSYYVIIIAGILFLLVNIFLLLTAYVNPGIIRRCPLPEVVQKSKSKNQIVYPTSSKDVQINGDKYRLFYCETCNIYRPPRTSHCRRCDQCVEKFDHHCPWVGSDVGLRNYRYFALFVFLITFSEYFIIVFSLVLLSLLTKKNFADFDGFDAFSEATKKAPETLIFAIFLLFTAWPTTNLSFFHFGLISQNLTTREFIKNRYQARENPFSHGCCGNWKEVFCSKNPKTNFSFKSFISENELESLKIQVLKPESKCWPEKKLQIIEFYQKYQKTINLKSEILKENLIENDLEKLNENLNENLNEDNDLILDEDNNENLKENDLEIK